MIVKRKKNKYDHCFPQLEGLENFIPYQNIQFYLLHFKSYTQIIGILTKEAWLLPNSLRMLLLNCFKITSTINLLKTVEKENHIKFNK